MISEVIKFLVNPLGLLEEERIYNEMKPNEMNETQLLKRKSKLLSTHLRCMYVHGISPREVKLKLNCVQRELLKRNSD